MRKEHVWGRIEFKPGVYCRDCLAPRDNGERPADCPGYVPGKLGNMRVGDPISDFMNALIFAHGNYLWLYSTRDFHNALKHAGLQLTYEPT